MGPATTVRSTAARRRVLAALPWLLTLYLLSLGAPVVQALAARGTLADASLVELCTGDGVRYAVLDGGGQPVGPSPIGDHPGHDCTACPAGCALHAFADDGRPSLVLVWPPFLPPRRGEPVVSAKRSIAAAPLPARGPPSLS